MTTPATCWKVTRRDAVVEGYTDHDADLIVSGVTYLSAVGYVSSAIERGSDMQADNQELRGIIDNENISDDDLRAGIYDGARVELLLVNWSTQALVSTLLVGHLGNVSIAENEYTVELKSIEAELAKPIGRISSLRCDADLGDSRCKYTLSADSGTVDTVTTARRAFTDTGRTEDDDYYANGKLVWTSGANTGRTMDIKKYTLSTQEIELFEPMASDIAPADEFDIYRGCDKRFETCRDTYANAINFRGRPYTPGVSDLISGQTGTG